MHPLATDRIICYDFKVEAEKAAASQISSKRPSVPDRRKWRRHPSSLKVKNGTGGVDALDGCLCTECSEGVRRRKAA